MRYKTYKLTWLLPLLKWYARWTNKPVVTAKQKPPSDQTVAMTETLKKLDANHPTMVDMAKAQMAAQQRILDYKKMVIKCETCRHRTSRIYVDGHQGTEYMCAMYPTQIPGMDKCLMYAEAWWDKSGGGHHTNGSTTL